MGKLSQQLSEQQIEFIAGQKIYFVATAAATGNVNLSPKGADSLRVIDPNTIVWLNLTGSGNESAAHVLQNPRMTLMFCAFDGAPLILRTYGTARVLHANDPDWAEYAALFPEYVAARQIFVQSIDQVQASCGTSVPLFDYQEERSQHGKWAEQKGRDGIEEYWVSRNQQSIDGFATEIVERSGLKTEQ